MMTVDADTVMVGDRPIAVGHYIKVLATAGNKSSFIGRVAKWWITDDGEITAIDVWGGPPTRERMRSVRPDRVEVLSVRMQNKLQRADEARKKGE